jgi:hypothetical protein
MKYIESFFILIGLILLYTIIMALPAMLLWNWLMPIIFGLTKINIYQSLGIVLLSEILFKSSSNLNKN